MSVCDVKGRSFTMQGGVRAMSDNGEGPYDLEVRCALVKS